jgi:hypothetical protein
MRRHLREGTFFCTPLLEMQQVPGRDWVKELLEELDSTHNGGGIAADFILDEGEIITLLVKRAPEKFQLRVRDAFAGWLQRHVQRVQSPEIVVHFLNHGWPIEKGGTQSITFYQAFCLFFREKLKNRPEVFRDFVGQTLSEVAGNQNILVGLPVQVAEILKKLDRQTPPTFEDFQNWLGRQFIKLEGMLGAIGSDVKDIKTGQARLESGQTEIKAGLAKMERQLSAPFAPRPGLAPPLPSLIIGRTEALHELKTRLGVVGNRGAAEQMQVLTAMRGLPGVGKTTIAAALAHDPDVQKAFPDGTLWASLGQKPELLSELAVWGRALGTDDLLRCRDLEEATVRMTGLLQQKRMLLIVDDAWESSHVMSFKVGGAGCAMLVTTRETSLAKAVAPTEADIYLLDVLTDEQALELLQRLAPAVVAQYSGQAMELVRELEGLPLGIQVAGRMLSVEAGHGFGVGELLADLRAGKKLLEAQAPADRADLAKETIPTVAVLLQKSTDRLDPKTRELYAYLAAFAPKPATFDLRAMQAVWEVADPKPAVRNLVDRGLLEWVEKIDRYQMHALLVLHARSLCTPE